MAARRQRILVTTNADCVRRKLDAVLLRNYFLANGYGSARRPESADLIVLVTCSYKKSKEDECFDSIRELGRHGGELLVAGCLPEIAGERLRSEFAGRFISTKTIRDVDRLFPHFDVKLSDLPDPHFTPVVSPFAYEIPSSAPAEDGGTGKRMLQDLGMLAWKTKEWVKFRSKATTEAFLRVGYGCVGGCAFCAINRAVGKLNSKSLAQCRKEYRELLDAGFRLFVIVADNIGAYGLDLGSSLIELLDGLSAEDRGLPVKWDIRQIAPKYLNRYRDGLQKYVEQKKIVSIHCPVQSGSSRILKLMNRDTDISGFRKTLEQFMATNPSLVLKTEAIIGFPSETEADFLETLDLLREIPFRQLSLFAYSEVNGTPASKLLDKIDQEIAFERIDRAKTELRGAGVEVLCDGE